MFTPRLSVAIYTRIKLLSIPTLIISTLATLVSCNESPVVPVEITQKEIIGNLNSDYQSLSDTDTDSDILSIDLPISCKNDDIVNAFNKKMNNRQVKGCGQIHAVLDDVFDESNYQRFVVELEDIKPELLVTVMHNVDISSRVKSLRKGDRVIFYGIYDYSNEGGIIHNTYKDVNKQLQTGWIEKDGERTQ